MYFPPYGRREKSDVAQNSNSSEVYAHAGYLQVWCRLDKKINKLSIGQHFPHYKCMGAWCCYGSHNFDLICPKTFGSRSCYTWNMIKIGQLTPEIFLFKCGHWTTTDSLPSPYYNLTLPGELIYTNKIPFLYALLSTDVYSEPSLYRHSIVQINSFSDNLNLKWDRYLKIFSNFIFNTPTNICWG